MYQFDKGHFLVVTSIMSIIAILKTILFYLIVKMLHNKNLLIATPFNHIVKKFILIVAYIAIGIGFYIISPRKNNQNDVQIFFELIHYFSPLSLIEVGNLLSGIDGDF